jgi:hypothetical protein
MNYILSALLTWKKTDEKSVTSTPYVAHTVTVASTSANVVIRQLTDEFAKEFKQKRTGQDHLKIELAALPFFWGD